MLTFPELSAFQAVVFDMDGTLIDSEGHYCNAYIHAMATLGGALEAEAYYRRFAGRTNEHIEVQLLAELPEEAGMERLRQSWRGEFDRLRATHGNPLMPGAAEMLDLIAEAGLPLAVASAADLADIKVSLDLAGIRDRFAALASGQEVANTKPAPDVFLLAAERLGIDPVRCLAIEDTNAGARAAIAAGMCTIMVPHQCEADELVREQARGIAASLTDLVAALR